MGKNEEEDDYIQYLGEGAKRFDPDGSKVRKLCEYIDTLPDSFFKPSPPS